MANAIALYFRQIRPFEAELVAGTPIFASS